MMIEGMRINRMPVLGNQFFNTEYPVHGTWFLVGVQGTWTGTGHHND